MIKNLMPTRLEPFPFPSRMPNIVMSPTLFPRQNIRCWLKHSVLRGSYINRRPEVSSRYRRLLYGLVWLHLCQQQGTVPSPEVIFRFVGWTEQPGKKNAVKYWFKETEATREADLGWATLRCPMQWRCTARVCIPQWESFSVKFLEVSQHWRLTFNLKARLYFTPKFSFFTPKCFLSRVCLFSEVFFSLFLFSFFLVSIWFSAAESCSKKLRVSNYAE